MPPLPGAEQFASYGTLGLLAFVSIVLVYIIYNMVGKVTSSMETRETEATAREKGIIEFVKSHQTESHLFLSEFRRSFDDQQKDLKEILGRQARSLDMVVLTFRVMEQIEQMRRRGIEVTDQQIMSIVRAISDEQRRDN